MSQDEETAIERATELGRRSALTQVIGSCLRDLDYGDRSANGWIVEREGAVAKLRELCEEFGDNDWPTNLDLADVIEKHLGVFLFENDGIMTDLLSACKLALGAFERNDAIDWGVLEAAIASGESRLGLSTPDS